MTESMMPDPNYQPTFENFRDLLVGQFRVILESCKPSNLFEVDVDPDEMYNIYLNSFREEDNPIFREREELMIVTCVKTLSNVLVEL